MGSSDRKRRRSRSPSPESSRKSQKKEESRKSSRRDRSSSPRSHRSSRRDRSSSRERDRRRRSHEKDDRKERSRERTYQREKEKDRDKHREKDEEKEKEKERSPSTVHDIEKLLSTRAEAQDPQKITPIVVPSLPSLSPAAEADEKQKRRERLALWKQKLKTQPTGSSPPSSPPLSQTNASDPTMASIDGGIGNLHNQTPEIKMEENRDLEAPSQVHPPSSLVNTPTTTTSATTENILSLSHQKNPAIAIQSSTETARVFPHVAVQKPTVSAKAMKVFSVFETPNAAAASSSLQTQSKEKWKLIMGESADSPSFKPFETAADVKEENSKDEPSKLSTLPPTDSLEEYLSVIKTQTPTTITSAVSTPTPSQSKDSPQPKKKAIGFLAKPFNAAAARNKISSDASSASSLKAEIMFNDEEVSRSKKKSSEATTNNATTNLSTSNEKSTASGVDNNDDDDDDDDDIDLSEDDPLNKILNRAKKKDLKQVDHTTVKYSPFKKNFYIEVPEISQMTSEDVEIYRVQLDDIRVKGSGSIKPIKGFHQCGFPDTM